MTTPADLFTSAEGLSGDAGAGAIGYVRVSTETQTDGYGLDIQRDAIIELAAAEGYELRAIYADEGESGSEGLDTREGLAQALNDLAEHPGTALIIPRLDRLARDLMVQESILADAWREHGEVISCSPTERIYCQRDTPDDPARTLIRQVLGAVAGYERDMIRLRMQRGRRRLLAEQGWAGGPKPYGFDDPDEAAVLRHVQACRQRGVPWQRIADQLNAAGKRKRNGRAWTPQEIHRVHARAVSRTQIEAEPLSLGQGMLLV